MKRSEIRLIIAKVLEGRERNRLLNLTEKFLYPPYTKKELLAVAPPLPEKLGVTDTHISYDAERLSDGTPALVGVKINEVPVNEIAAKLDKR